MATIREISFHLPQKDTSLFEQFCAFLGDVGEKIDIGFILRKHADNEMPRIAVKLDSIDTPQVVFTSEAETKVISLLNTTGEERTSPHSYIPINIFEFMSRLHGITVEKVDHVGFNLPWFGKGVHPEIKALRTWAKDKCLYHVHPKNELWDFILPGTIDEIEGGKIDYSIVRRPKLEIVSFDKCSTPLIQFDISLNMEHNLFPRLFPEGIRDTESNNQWVYIENPYGIDFCFVLNEYVDENDWCKVFKGHRLA
ncbi:hypothetical protein HGB07_01980 [Candidatus Roizmanbacteria bacterium]|nr:hypothetical protein [Candidatus Roizmanbacteria bacterium]